MISLYTQETLRSLGFSSKEIKMYVALLSGGRASAYALARRTGLKKPTAYVVLETLIEKGLVCKIPRSKKKLYEAQSPRVLEQMSLRKLKEVQSMLPNLLALTIADATSVKTLFFEGVEGMRQAYAYRQDELANTEFVGFYGSATNLDISLERIMYDWNVENARLRITSRTLVPDDPSLEEFRKHDAEHLRTVKKVSVEEYSSALSMEVTQFFVRISLYSESEKQSVILDSPRVAFTFRQIFEMLWKRLSQKNSGFEFVERCAT